MLIFLDSVLSIIRLKSIGGFSPPPARIESKLQPSDISIQKAGVINKIHSNDSHQGKSWLTCQFLDRLFPAVIWSTHPSFNPRGSAMWVIDIRHMLDDTQSGPAIPRLKLKVQKLVEIITFATSTEAGILISSPPACWRRPKRKACTGKVVVDLVPDTDQIHWVCPECGDEGVVTGWKGLIWDMTDCPFDSIN